jgi:hypothetical protein
MGFPIASLTLGSIAVILSLGAFQATRDHHNQIQFIQTYHVPPYNILVVDVHQRGHPRYQEPDAYGQGHSLKGSPAQIP